MTNILDVGYCYAPYIPLCVIDFREYRKQHIIESVVMLQAEYGMLGGCHREYGKCDTIAGGCCTECLAYFTDTELEWLTLWKEMNGGKYV